MSKFPVFHADYLALTI